MPAIPFTSQTNVLRGVFIPQNDIGGDESRYSPLDFVKSPTIPFAKAKYPLTGFHPTPLTPRH